jgi:mono/diheme cytochrome c family protein
MIKGKGDDSGPDLTKEGDNREAGWIAQYIRSPDALYEKAEMPGFGKKLNKAEIDDLAAYLSAQRAEQPQVKKAPKK